MRVLENTNQNQSNVSSTNSVSTASTATQIREYHELADQPVVEYDITQQVRENLARLADLQARLQFLMREVKYLMKL